MCTCILHIPVGENFENGELKSEFIKNHKFINDHSEEYIRKVEGPSELMKIESRDVVMLQT